MAVMPKGERAVLVHFGDASPGDDSQSFMCEAVSACRALRIKPSRSMPGGIVLACSLRLRACSASRSSKEVSCLMRRRCCGIRCSIRTRERNGDLITDNCRGSRGDHRKIVTADAFVCPLPDGSPR